MFYPVLVLALFTCAGWNTVDARCDLDAFRVCLEPLTKYGDAAKSASSGSFNVTVLKALCVDFGPVSSCGSQTTSTCSTEEKIVWEVLDNTFSYLCGPGMQPYIDNAECLNQPKSTAAVTACRGEQDQSTHTITQSAYMSGEEKMRRLCDIMDTTTSCVRNAVSICSQAAVNVMTELLNEAFKPSRRLINCRTSDAGRLYCSGWILMLMVVAFVSRFM